MYLFEFISKLEDFYRVNPTMMVVTWNFRPLSMKRWPECGSLVIFEDGKTGDSATVEDLLSMAKNWSARDVGLLENKELDFGIEIIPFDNQGRRVLIVRKCQPRPARPTNPGVEQPRRPKARKPKPVEFEILPEEEI